MENLFEKKKKNVWLNCSHSFHKRGRELDIQYLSAIVQSDNRIEVWLLFFFAPFHVRLFSTKRKKWCATAHFISAPDTHRVYVCVGVSVYVYVYVYAGVVFAHKRYLSVTASVPHAQNKWWEPKWMGRKERIATDKEQPLFTDCRARYFSPVLWRGCYVFSSSMCMLHSTIFFILSLLPF